MQTKTTGGATDFAAVYAEHYPSVARTAFLLLGESGEAEEITQEAFATLFQRWDTVLNPAGFVRTAMLNRCRDTGRRRTIRLKLIRRIGNQQHDQAEPEFVLDMLKRLDHQLREVVVLRY